MQLTAIILTLNEETHIGDCIASLAWADAVVVFDSFSTDQTVEIARKAGATIAQSPFENYAQQRNASLDFVTQSGNTDWVLFIDADERTTPNLAAEIRAVINNRPEAGWSVPRHNYIFGKLTKGAGWWPDYQARLFRLGKVRYERPVHEVAVVDGGQGELANPLTHYNYRDVAHFHAVQRKYTAYEAGILRDEGIRPKPYTPYTLAVRHWWWRFVTLKGYRVGLHGLRLSTLMAYYEYKKYRQVRSG